MEQHKWIHNNIKFNFCIKCGITKSSSTNIPCHMKHNTWKLELSHSVLDKPVMNYDLVLPFQNKKNVTKNKFYLNNFESSEKFCERCEINNYKSRYYAVHFEKITMNAFVPYTLEKVIDKTYAKYVMRNEAFHNPKILYWPIYCAYTDKDMLVKSIVSNPL